MTREELYSLVWSIPATEVARKAGVSNARLRQICREFDVPLPTAGYWTKLAHGKAPQRPALPTAKPPILSRINTLLRRLGEVPLAIADDQVRDYDLTFHPEPSITAAPRHSYAERLSHALATAGTNAEGFVELSSSAIPKIRIAPACAARTVEIVDRVLRACADQGFEISESPHGLSIGVDGEAFCLTIYSTRAKRNHGQSPNKAEQLVLRIHDPREFRWTSRNLVGHWRDRNDLNLDRLTEDVVSKIRTSAKVIKTCRGVVERHTEAVEAQLATQRSMALARQTEQRERDFLLALAEEYSRYQNLLAFTHYVQNQVRGNKKLAQLRIVQRLDALASEIGNRFELTNLEMEFTAQDGTTPRNKRAAISNSGQPPKPCR